MLTYSEEFRGAIVPPLAGQIALYRTPFHPYLIYLGWRFEGFKSALDARSESRGIPEAYMLTYSEAFRGAITQQMTCY